MYIPVPGSWFSVQILHRPNEIQAVRKRMQKSHTVLSRERGLFARRISPSARNPPVKQRRYTGVRHIGSVIRYV